MIYVGYPGIGKSTLAKTLPNCIDLESNNFWVDGKRIDDWYKVYANIAKHLSDQGKIVFVSSHKLVREYMNEVGIEFTVILPNFIMKNEWVKKLMERYEAEPTEKNQRALDRAMISYEDDIMDLMAEKNNKIIIKNINYNLEYLISGQYDPK
jgi:tRNA uridine 5-carbamoylmethylation protein Kti12